MAVPQRVPLAVAHDRGQRVELQQQHAARAGAGRPARPRPPPGRGRASSRSSRAPRLPGPSPSTTVSPLSASRPSHEPPWGLPYSAALAAGGQPPGLGDPGRRRRPPARRGRRARRPGAPRAWSDRSAAGPGRTGAQPHLQRVDRVGARVAGRREVVGRRLVAEVEDDLARRRTAGAAAVRGRRSQASVISGVPSGWHDGGVHVRTTSLAGVLVFEPDARTATSGACSPARSTPRWRPPTASTAPRSCRTRSRARPGACCAGMHGRRRRRRGEARALRPRRRPRRPRRRPAGLADVRGARGVPARRRGLPPPLRAAGAAARVPGPHRRGRRLLPHRPARTTRPPTSRCATTTPIWRSPGPSR